MDFLPFPFNFIVLIIVITTVGSVLKSFATGKADDTDAKLMGFTGSEPDPKLEAENRELRKEISDLRERLHVIERITVDKENTLAREIEDLRKS